MAAEYRNRVADVRSASTKSVGIVGGGLAGSLFALKLAAARPDWTLWLVEAHTEAGRGLAYGACAPHHLLNVPVGRMEVGLAPRFGDWLRRRPDIPAEALAESEGKLEDAFVPRYLFGDYIAERLAEAVSSRGADIRRVAGAAVAISEHPRRIVTANGFAIPADTVVLATGNLPPALPIRPAASKRIVADPWAPGALARIAPDAPLLLIGSGLTMVDTVLSLRANGHAAAIHVVSRHGLLPRAHRTGGAWPPFLSVTASPLQAFAAIRAALYVTQAQGIPWQRVFDAVRPSVAMLWQGWNLRERARFLRHLRSLWEVHRHRVAGRIASVIDDLVKCGVLTVTAGRVLSLDEHRGGLSAAIRPRGAQVRLLEVGAVVNCTGPQTDFRKTDHPLLRDLLARGLIRSDPIGLGLESEDCAVRTAHGDVSDWLYALGPLTRPAWWEITAVPEINAQIDRLVGRLSEEALVVSRPLARVFLDMGAGI